MACRRHFLDSGAAVCGTRNLFRGVDIRKRLQSIQKKKILVLGLAKSGVMAASLLHKLGAFVTVNDMKPLSENPEAQGLLERGIKVICGSHPIELLDEGFETDREKSGNPYPEPIVKGALEKGFLLSRKLNWPTR